MFEYFSLQPRIHIQNQSMDLFISHPATIIIGPSSNDAGRSRPKVFEEFHESIYIKVFALYR